MNKKLWEASTSQKKKSLLSSYEQFISKKFKIENADRPNKGIIYPIAILLLIIFGYLNYRRKE
ncbi:hypothetical protein N8922_01955 [Candidatus Pelagibacter sp.]|nr:hypothetical protein [Candidatus Pelagibacter sp.]